MGLFTHGFVYFQYSNALSIVSLAHLAQMPNNLFNLALSMMCHPVLLSSASCVDSLAKHTCVIQSQYFKHFNMRVYREFVAKIVVQIYVLCTTVFGGVSLRNP